MKYSSFYDHAIGCNNAETVFANLIQTLKPTIKDWDYFVNWKKN